MCACLRKVWTDTVFCLNVVVVVVVLITVWLDAEILDAQSGRHLNDFQLSSPR